MPKHLAARPPLDAAAAHHVRKLAHSGHAPADWIIHAKMIVSSWDGQRTAHISADMGCHPQTVRDRLHAFNERGLDGLGMPPGSGRPPRLTPLERRTILALVKRPPPGKPTYALTGELAAPNPAGEPEWTRDTLTAAAQQRGLQVARSHVRRLFRRAGVRWRRTRRWATSTDPACAPRVPTRTRLVALSTAPPEGATVVCVDELGPVTPRNFPPAPGWSPDGHRSKVPLEYDRGREQVGVSGALCVRTGQVLKRDRARAHHRRLPGAAAHARPGLSPGRSLPHCRPPRPPHQWSHPGLVGRSPACPARLHSRWRRLAHPHRGLVAPLPAHSLRRGLGRQRRRQRLCYPHRHRPAQPPGQTLGLGTPTAPAPHASSLFRLPPLRNNAITLICHVGAGSLCLLAARPVEVRWRAVCLPEEYSAHKG